MTGGEARTKADEPFLLTIVVSAEDEGKRLDACLAELTEALSRAQIQRAISQGLATVDGKPQKASFRVAAGQRIEFAAAAPPTGPEPEPIALDILREDDQIAVINKPAGMVVHPAKGHWSGTLASALAHHFQQLSNLGGPARPGIVHRLDRDTSGAIVVAKTDQAHSRLADQFKARTVEKEYLAIVVGAPDRDRDRIDHPIGPHPSQREKMALRADHTDSRSAETFYEVLQRFPGFALVSARPKTGRTHQIRLHLAHIGCPVLCDKLYGGRSQITAGELRRITQRKGLIDNFADDEVLLDRQALHARRLAFDHPETGERTVIEAPLAGDIQQLLDSLSS